jgi:PadR family transcriptional regulator, regulatory protein PadR
MQATLLYTVEAMSAFFDNWVVQVRKGVLEWSILRALHGQERYGYELVKTLASVPGLALTEGTLYPLLSRLRVAGLVSARLEESDEGPARKYYSLTREGKRTLAAMDDFLEKLNQGTQSLSHQRSYEHMDNSRSSGSGGLS